MICDALRRQNFSYIYIPDRETRVQGSVFLRRGKVIIRIKKNYLKVFCLNLYDMY